jgi:hypothetical protein
MQNVSNTCAPSISTSFLCFFDAAYPVWRSVNTTLTFSKSRVYAFPITGIQGPLQMPQGVGSGIPINITANNIGTTTTVGTPATWMTPELPLGMVLGDPSAWFFVPTGALLAITANITMDVTGFSYTLGLVVSPDCGVNTTSIRIDGTGAVNAINFYGDRGATTSGVWVKVVDLAVASPAVTAASIIDSISVGFTTGNTLTVPSGGIITGFWPVLGLGRAELTVAPDIYTGCRLNAASVLFQNTTAVLSKEGNIKAGVIKVADSRVLSDQATLLSYYDDSAAALRYPGNLEKGLYAYYMPEMKKFDLRDHAVLATAPQPVMALGEHLYMYYIEFTTAANAQTFQITLTVHHECENDSMLFPIGVSRLTLESVRQARAELNLRCPFTENPIHWAKLLAMARGAAVSAWRAARPNFNPWAHQAVDYLIPKYRNLEIRDDQAGFR